MIDSLLNFFITSAHADVPAPAPSAASGAASFSLPLMLLVFIAFLYLTVWRPQNRRAKEQKELLNSISKGDEVVTTGGIVGKISKVSQSYVTLALTDSVEVLVQKSAIATVLPKGTMKSL